MTWPVLVGIAVALVAAFAAGCALGLRRCTRGCGASRRAWRELSGGNLAHRVILPGDDEAARMAEDAQPARRRHPGRARGGGARATPRAASCSRTSRTTCARPSRRSPATWTRCSGDSATSRSATSPSSRAKTDELAQLTDDLFYEARLDAGDLELKRSAARSRGGGAPLGPRLRAAARRAWACAWTSTYPRSACVVEADPSAVARILSNLVANAHPARRGHDGVLGRRCSPRTTTTWSASATTDRRFPTTRAAVRAGRHGPRRRRGPRPVDRSGAGGAHGRDRRAPRTPPTAGVTFTLDVPASSRARVQTNRKDSRKPALQPARATMGVGRKVIADEPERQSDGEVVIRTEGLTKRFGDVRRGRRISRSRSAAARSTRSSGGTGRARPPRSA